MSLTDDERALLPSEEDVAYFRQHGYWVTGPIFTPEEIEDARYGIERFYAGECDFPLTAHVRRMTGWKSGDPDVQRTNDYVSLLVREVNDFVAKPIVGAIAAHLVGTPTIRLWHDQLIIKNPTTDPGQSGIGWHTDKAYWQTCSSDRMITAWIPLHDTTMQLGPLLVVGGSQRWSGFEGLRGFHFTDLDRSAEQVNGRALAEAATPILVRAGQVSFHHCLTIHGSGANTSSSPRISLSVHLQDASNCYREARTGNGEQIWHRNDVLCRKRNNQPDYADPDICPVLWSE
jgi:hypothetical protein